MKNTYCFVFGKTPQLSLAELMSVLGSDANFLLVNSEVAIVELSQKVDLEVLQDRLGGIIKIGVIFEKLIDFNLADWTTWYQAPAERFQFGFSSFGLSRSEREQLKKQGLGLKKQWVSAGSACRLVVSREPSLSSVIVIKEKLLKSGADFLVIKDGASGQFWLGQTIACQKFADYSEAEFNRPLSDSRRGMIPVKLAKIMLNLADQKQQSILDPFCGLGTILTAAADLGWIKAGGSDVDPLAVKQAKVNWQWSAQKNNFKTLAEFKVGSAAEVGKLWVKQQFTSIVTEPDLGPALRHLPEPAQFNVIIKKLTDLYQTFLNQALEILATDGMVVMIWPAWSDGHSYKFLLTEKIINFKSWQIVDFKQTHYQLQPQSFSERGSLWYARPGQLVAREIWVLKKK